MIKKEPAILVAYILGSVAKGEWLQKNVDSLERISGFPTKYLEAHLVEARTALKSWSDSGGSARYPELGLQQLQTIDSAGFLREYFADYYRYTLLIPDSIPLNTQGYYAWKSASGLTINRSVSSHMLSYRREQAEDK